MRKPHLPESIVRVLLVDDEMDFTSALSKRLRLRGLEVQTACDGSEAYAMLEIRSYDVVVLDIKMPGVDGLQVLKTIKRNFQGVEVILLTGQGTISDALASHRSGAFDFLTKPVEMDILEAKIRAAANKVRETGGFQMGGTSNHRREHSV